MKYSRSLERVNFSGQSHGQGVMQTEFGEYANVCVRLYV